MSLSTHFNERAPHYWLLLGLLLIITGTYLAIAMQRSYLYIAAGAGLACCMWSIRIFVRRRMRPPKPYYDVELDQTCELNHNPAEF